MQLRRPAGRHVLAAIFLLIETPIILALLAGAAVTGAVHVAALLPERLHALARSARRRSEPRPGAPAAAREVAHA